MFTTKLRCKFTLEAYEGLISNKDRVIDIGCGNCYITKKIQEKFKCDMSATDIINYCKGVTFVSAKDGLIPAPDKFFDVALLNDVLHHTTEQEKLIKEANRIAKRVIIVEPEPTLFTKFFDITLNFIHNPAMPTPLKFRTHDEWCMLFDDMRFDLHVKKLKKPWWYPLSEWLYELRCGK